MAAGLGFKTFTTGEVLTAADVNGYLMQGILVFASEAARNSAITSPQEGQFAFTKDNNSLWYYTGSAWVASGATGDIEGVTAGVGISGGGTSGTVTITNSMATEITAAGDIIVGTGSATFDNLPIGSTGQVLTADTTVSPYKVKWATPASGNTYSGVSATKSTGQTIATGTWVAVTWDTENFDTDAYHNNSTNTSRFTIPAGKAGKYLVSGSISWAGTSSGTFRLVSIYKNGVEQNQVVQGGPTADGTIQPFAHIYDLAVADYIEIYVRHNIGSDTSVQGGAAQSRVEVSLIGA